MRPRRDYPAILVLLLLPVLAGACTASLPNFPEGFYYVKADMTYLRDGALLDSNVVGQLYKGDRVEKLAAAPADWWRVRSARSGQVGWVAAELLSSTPVPVPLWVATRSVNLREGPNDLCPALKQLARGERVQKIDQNDQGWWRVLVMGSRMLGWLPAAALAERLEKAQSQAPTKEAEKAYLYVAVPSLKLLRQPPPAEEVVTQLHRNDRVEKLEQNDAGWLKVRQPSCGAVGWVPASDLEPRPVGSRRAHRWKKAEPLPSKPVETEKQAAPLAEPEIM